MKTIEEKPEWERELQNILIEWEKGNPVIGAMRVGSRTLTLSRFIYSLLDQQRKRFLEMIPKKLDENWRRTEQEPTKDEQTFIEGFNACIAELRNKINSLEDKCEHRARSYRTVTYVRCVKCGYESEENMKFQINSLTVTNEEKI